MSRVFVVTSTDGSTAFKLQPGQLNSPISNQTDSDLRLYGQGTEIWGDGYNQNFFRLLENFAVAAKQVGDFNPATGNNDYDPNSFPILPKDANDLGPGRGINKPVTGQLWYEKLTAQFFVFDESLGQIFGWRRATSTVADSSSPTTPQLGDLWYDTNVDQLKVWNGMQWVSVTEQYVRLDGTSTMSGSLDLGSNKAVNVADPTNAQDATTKNYVDTEINNIVNNGALDDQYVLETGDTMNGTLTFTNQSFVRVDNGTSTLDLGSNDGDVNSGADVKKNSLSMMSAADLDYFIHFNGSSFRVASGGDSRQSSFNDLLVVEDSGNVRVRSGYQSLSDFSDSSLTNKIYVDNSIANRTVSNSGGTFTGAVTIESNLSLEPGDLFVDGKIEATGDIIAFASDVRLKNNISKMQNCLDKVNSIEPVEFDWSDFAIEQIKPSNNHQSGVLAQQVQKVLPDIVHKAPFDNNYLTVQYDKLTTILIGAINELTQTVEQQQQQINTLRQRLDN